MRALKQKLLTETGLIFLISLILIAGLSYGIMITFKLQESVDPKSYWGLAHLDFHQSPHRRYRFVIPFLAAGINWLIQGIAHLIRPGTLTGDFSLQFSFWVVNVTIIAAWCTLIYRYCRAYAFSRLSSFFGLLAVATSWWTANNAGQPMVDSLFCLAVICGLLGIKEKNRSLILLSVLAGPFTKENYLFFAPVVFFFAPMPKWKLFLWFLLSGAAVFATRYFIDRAAGQPMSASIEADLNILNAIPFNIRRLKIMGYWNELFATFGLWVLVPPVTRLALGRSGDKRRIFTEPYLIAFLLTSAFQILIHGEYARIMYLLMPAWALAIAGATARWEERLKDKAPMLRGVKGDINKF